MMGTLGDDANESGVSAIDHFAAILVIFSLVFVSVVVISTSSPNTNDNDNHNNYDGVVDTEGGWDADEEEEEEEVPDELDAMEAGRCNPPDKDVTPSPSAGPNKIARQYYSIAHEDIIMKQIIYIHLDIKHGGPDCGLLQLSAVFMDAE